ncbi:unnamed protein product [Closterium sp. NIES-53]
MGTRTRLWPPLPLSRALVSTHFTLAPESSSSSSSRSRNNSSYCPRPLQVLVSGPVAASCSWRSLAHPTVLWHHRFGHPPIPRLCAMSSQRLVLGLPRVLPSLPPLLAPPCVPCVEGRLRTTPLSSSLRPATEPFETLHLDVRGPAARPDPKRESFFFVVVDDYSRYTTVFPLVKNSQVTSTLIRWFITTMDTRGRRVSYLHSERGGEFRSDVLAGFCRKQGICQFWTVPESPRDNGVAERRIGLIMEIARTSMTLGVVRLVLWRAVLGLPPPRTLLLPPTPTGPGTMPVFAVHQAQQQQPPPPPPTSPLAVGGESALGCDALEDRQFELEFLAAASPHLYAMLLALEGDPGALHIPTPYTYAEAVSRPWASQWRAATDSEMASYKFTGTYVNKFPPPGVNVVDGMWIFRVKRPPGSPPVFKARMWLEPVLPRQLTLPLRTIQEPPAPQPPTEPIITPEKILSHRAGDPRDGMYTHSRKEGPLGGGGGGSSVRKSPFLYAASLRNAYITVLTTLSTVTTRHPRFDNLPATSHVATRPPGSAGNLRSGPPLRHFPNLSPDLSHTPVTRQLQFITVTTVAFAI